MSRAGLWGGVVVAGVLAAGGWGLWSFLASDSKAVEEAEASSVAGPERSEPRRPSEFLGDRSGPVPTVIREIDEPLSEVDARVALPQSYLQALSGLRGRVVEADGVPVADVSVELLQASMGPFAMARSGVLSGAEFSLDQIILARTVTDAEGRFHLGGASVRGFQALGIDLGGDRSTLRVVDQGLVSAETRDLGDIVLEPFVTFLGTVLDESGRPLSGVRVRATLLPKVGVVDGVQNIREESLGVLDFMDRQVFELPRELLALANRLPIPTTYSDAEGNFRLAGVPYGLATVLLDLRGYAGTVHGPVPTGKRAERKLGSIMLRRGDSFEGVVLDQDSNPVAGVEVAGGVMLAGSMVGILQRVGRSDEQGRFRVEGVPSGTQVAIARVTPDSPWVFSETADAGAEQRVILERPGVFPVHVVDEKGEFLAGATLGLRPKCALAEGPFPMLAPYRSEPGRSVEVSPGIFEVRGLPPGKYHVVAMAEGRATAVTEDFVVFEEGMEPLLMTLGSERRLQVRVVDVETNEPVEYALAEIGPPLRENFLYFGRGRTDREGAVELSGLPSSFVRDVILSVSHPGYAVTMRKIEPGEWPELEAVEVGLGRGATISGHLTENGGPPSKPYFVILTPRGRELAHPDSNVPRFALPDEEGNFRISLVPPGSYGWSVMERFLDGNPMRLFPDRAEELDSLADGVVDVSAGEANELSIDLDPSANEANCKLVGRLDVAQGRALEMDVHVRGTTNRTLSIRSGEAFETALRAGKYDVTVTGEGKNAWEGALYNTSFELAPFGTHHLEHTLVAVSITLQVTNSAGEAVADVNCTIFPVGSGSEARDWGGSPRWGRTDRTGEAKFLLPAAGTWRVSAMHSGVGSQLGDYEVEDGTTLSLQLDAGVPCAGRVEVPAGVKLGGEASLSVNSPSAGSSTWVQLNSGRAFEIYGLKAGKYSVNLFDWDNDVSLSTEFEIPEGGDRGLVLRFEPDGG